MCLNIRMSFAAFRELCEACYVSREQVEMKYSAHPTKPWSSCSDDYSEDIQRSDAANFMNAVFGDDVELNLPELSIRINALQRRMTGTTGPIWNTIGNIRVAIARNAADSFRKYMEVLPESPELDGEDIRRNGKPSPYGGMDFPRVVRKPDGSSVTETHPADYEAAAMMYERD